MAYADRETVIEQIMSQLETGKSLVQVCKQDNMPDRETVSRWMRDEPGFAARYAHARAMQADTLFAEMALIEDKVTVGSMDSHAARVVLDSMRWIVGTERPDNSASVLWSIPSNARAARIWAAVIIAVSCKAHHEWLFYLFTCVKYHIGGF